MLRVGSVSSSFMYLSNFASCNFFYLAVCFEIINLSLHLLYDTREDDAFGFSQDMVGFTGDALESLLTVSLSKIPCVTGYKVCSLNYTTHSN